MRSGAVAAGLAAASGRALRLCRLPENLESIAAGARSLGAAEALGVEEIGVERARVAVDDHLGDAFADRRRELEAVTAETGDEHEAFEPGQRTDRRLAVRCDRVERAATAPQHGARVRGQAPLYALARALHER